MQLKSLVVSTRTALLVATGAALALSSLGAGAQPADALASEADTLAPAGSAPQVATQPARPAASADSSSARPQRAASAPGQNVQKPATLGAVVVVGQLLSLQRSAAAKRDAAGIVDAVSAAEVGQFPDTNVADALQRVPGVSVNRSGGEANEVTVRGFGPDFVNVLVNGRTMATANPGRAFDFDTLPAELIQQALVYKTSNAALPSGGIGGTVNIITAQPLDFNGFHIAFSGAGVSDHTGGGGIRGKVKPKVDVVLGDTNADHTFGWVLSGLYYQRDHLEEAVEADGWDMGLDLSRLGPGLDSVSAPQTVQADYFPQMYIRKSVNGALEWSPNDKLHVKFNTLWTGFQQTGQESSLGSFFIPDNITAAKVDANGTALQYTRTGTGVDDSLVMANDYIESSTPQNTKSYMTGANISYQISPATEVDLDSYVSKAWNKPGSDGYFIVLGTKNFDRDVTWTNNGPMLLPSYSNLVSTTDVNSLRAHYMQTGSQNVTGKVRGNKLHLSTEFLDGPLTRLDFGAKNTNESKTLVTFAPPGVPGNGFGAAEYNGYIASVPAGAAGAYVLDTGSEIGQMAPGEPTQWVTYDVGKLLQYYATPAAYGQLPDPDAFAAELAANGGGFVAHPSPITYSRIVEHTRSAYGMATLDGTIWTLPWHLNVGVRYTTTATVSYGITQPLLGLSVNPADLTVAVAKFGPESPVVNNGTYHDWLPSLNLRVNIRPDLLLRFAVSKTLTRPDLGELASAQSWNFDNVHLLTLATGNTALKPFTSFNVDAGIEWYFKDSSYIAFEVFHKKVQDFTTDVTVNQQIFGFPFLVTEPVNLNSAKVRGAEVTVNYQFTDIPRFLNGFGVALNYTYVHSSASANPDIIATTGQFAIPGMGNSYNASLYYQKHRVQARLAWNWRGHYLSSVANFAGFPETTTPYGQLDLSASYALTKHTSVFVQGTNLTNERIHTYQIFPNMADYAEADGQTWFAGFRGHW
jgi:TonB-dependent receptor